MSAPLQKPTQQPATPNNPYTNTQYASNPYVTGAQPQSPITSQQQGYLQYLQNKIAYSGSTLSMGAQIDASGSRLILIYDPNNPTAMPKIWGSIPGGNNTPSIPNETLQQQALNTAIARGQIKSPDGSYIKDVSYGINNGSMVVTGVTFGDIKQTQQQQFNQSWWAAQGLPQYGGYEVPKLADSQYVRSAKVDTQGNLQLAIGDYANEQYWYNKGLPQYADLFEVPKVTAEQEQQGFYIKDVTAGAGGPNVALANKNWEQQWASLGVPDSQRQLVIGYEPPSGLSQGSYVKDLSQTSQGLSFLVGNKFTEAKAANINSQLNTINAQNAVFSNALNLKQISSQQFQTAMQKQTQNTEQLLGEAQSLGLISESERQAQVNQMSLYMKNIDTSIKNLTKFTGLTSTINSQNEIFSSKLLSGDISQLEYNKALAYQNQLEIKGIQQALIEGVISEKDAKDTINQINVNFQDFLNSQKVKAPFGQQMVGPSNTQPTTKGPALIPTGMGFMPMSTFMAGHNDPTMQNVVIPGLEAAAVVGGAIVAPEVVIPGVIAGEGLNIGINSAVKSFATKSPQLVLPTSVREVTDTALLSAGLSLVGAGALGAIGKVAPALMSEGANPIFATVTRTGVNAGLGAGVSAVASGGNPVEIAKGAAFGAGLGLAGEFAGVVNAKYAITEKVTNVIPIPKLGSVDIPITSPEGESTVSWKGVYVSKGEEANPIFGKMGNIPEGATIQGHGISGEEPGFSPVSNIETKITQQFMEKAGYPKDILQDVKDTRSLMSDVKNTPSKFIKDLLPTETGTLSAKGVAATKEYVLVNNKSVDKLYGSFTQRAQVSEEFEYTKLTPTGEAKSALRTPNDIDIMLKNQTSEQAEHFTQGLLGKLTDVGEQVRISPEKPTLIEANVEGKWAHAIDIHYPGEPLDIANPTPKSKYWGIKANKAIIKIEKLPSQTLGSQVLAKGNSILGFTDEAMTGEGTLGPVTHRVKDVPDFFQDTRTLLESQRGGPSEGQAAKLNRLAVRYGVDLNKLPIGITEYDVSPSSSGGKTPRYGYPMSIMSPSSAKIAVSSMSSKSAMPSPSVSPSLASYSPIASAGPTLYVSPAPIAVSVSPENSKPRSSVTFTSPSQSTPILRLTSNYSLGISSVYNSSPTSLSPNVSPSISPSIISPSPSPLQSITSPSYSPAILGTPSFSMPKKTLMFLPEEKRKRFAIGRRGGGRFFELKNPIVTPKILASRFLGGNNARSNRRQPKRSRRTKKLLF